jgi:hypothetical protein
VIVSPNDKSLIGEDSAKTLVFDPSVPLFRVDDPHATMRNHDVVDVSAMSRHPTIVEDDLSGSEIAMQTDVHEVLGRGTLATVPSVAKTGPTKCRRASHGILH